MRNTRAGKAAGIAEENIARLHRADQNRAIRGRNAAAMFYVHAVDASIVIEGNLASNFSNSAPEIAYALAKRPMPELVEWYRASHDPRSLPSGEGL